MIPRNFWGRHSNLTTTIKHRQDIGTMKRFTHLIQCPQSFHNLVVHSLLYGIEINRHHSLDWLSYVRKALEHRPANANTTNQLLELLFLFWINTHDLAIA